MAVSSDIDEDVKEHYDSDVNSGEDEPVKSKPQYDEEEEEEEEEDEEEDEEEGQVS